ncbi:CaiB/BaiF CoA-transferase family protein [Brevibacillus choshinensis]|uniref:CaiB/BaiF CoA transferase family protein n=1 Tax=Brevibacillus choshinensis TaxID=54911 RepID=UPI002E1BC851|nr:CaiB/BaiF CoA-transferase family protein [Brevibacillus choshinensis]
MGALNGIKVLDLSRLLPGPYCSLMLADYGAEVIKIEEPGLGDYARWGQPRMKGGLGANFQMVNRNKKSVALNLKTEEGKTIFKEMAKEADVILESFRPGVMKKLGIAYEEIAVMNPRIIYCSLTGFGQTGPYRDLPGHDINYIGYSGVLGATGERNGGPILPGVLVGDLGGGALMAVSGICMALFHRERTGEGQYVDMSITDGAITWQYGVGSPYFATGEVPERGKMRLNGKYACYGVYQTRDGKYLSVGALEEKFWQRVCQLVDKPEWISRKDAPDDVQEQLREEMTQLFLSKDQKDWLELLKMEDTCVGPVYDLDEVFADPHVRHREMLVEVDHPVAGKIKQIGFPIKFSRTPGEWRNHAPLLGEHTAIMLTQINYSPEQIEKLKEQGVIGIPEGSYE